MVQCLLTSAAKTWMTLVLHEWSFCLISEGRRDVTHECDKIADRIRENRWAEVKARDGRMSVPRTVPPTFPLAGLDWVIFEFEPILSCKRFTRFNNQ